jgi:hypothetical protein
MVVARSWCVNGPSPRKAPRSRSSHRGSSGEEIPKIATTKQSTGADKRAEISEIATTTNTDGVGKGAEISHRERRNQPGGEDGSVADGKDEVPMPKPNPGGTSTANAASDDRSDAGTEIADERSAGRSAAGSGNGNSGRSP